MHSMNLYPNIVPERKYISVVQMLRDRPLSLYTLFGVWDGSQHNRYRCTTGRYIYIQDLKNIKNVKGCRDGMPKSMQTR